MPSSMSRILSAMRAGRLREAEALCRQALAQAPQNPSLVHMLGVIAGQTGRHDMAADLMRQSIALAPDEVAFRRNLATALLSLRQFEEAEAVLREALGMEPEEPKLLAALGAALGGQGKTEEGIEILEKTVAVSPETASFHFNLAELYRRHGEKSKAVTHFEKALELNPNHADALNNLAGLLLKEGDFLDALRSIQRLLQLRPRSAQAYCNLATAMRAAGDVEAAVTSLRNAMQLEPESPQARFQLANMLINVGQLDEADEIMRQLREMDPDDPIAFKTAHARILERKGDIAGAAAIVDTIDDEFRRHPDVAIIRAIVQEQQGDIEAAAKTLEEAVEADEMVAIEGIGIQFTLGQYYDSLGRYDEAFEAYRIGNENRKKAFIKIDAPKEPGEGASDDLIELFDPQEYRDIPSSTLDSEVPILIIGMPRSGTSLTEQILASHSQVYGAGELTALRNLIRETYDAADKPRVPFEIVDTDPSADHACMVPKGWESITAEQLNELGEKYLAHLKTLGGDAPRVTDKMPYNYFLAPVIHKMFPRARILHCCRHPLDTCLSCYFQNFTGGSQYAFDLSDLGTFYRNYLKLMAHWRDALQVPMLEVDYEELVSDPEPNVRKILEYCGLDWDPECMNFHKSKRIVSTASYQQVRQPIYTKSAGRWKNYEKHLGPLIESLGSDAAKLERSAAVT